MSDRDRGTLWLVPSSLDHGTQVVSLDEVLPHGVLRRAAGLRHWRVEDARSARAFLKRVNAVVPLAAPLQQIDIVELLRPQKGTVAPAASEAAWDFLLRPAMDGADIGVLAEAGMPAVADPGAHLVAAAHRSGLVVLPLAGPSALLLALAASGLNGQSFAFVGYLPTDLPGRQHRLRELESLSRRHGQTQLFIETPYRNAAMLASLLECLMPATRLSVSCGLTLPEAWTRSARVHQWRSEPRAVPDRLPAVFALLAD